MSTVKRNKTFLIRVDASAHIGAGHLMRMLSLGQLLVEAGHDVHVATIPHNPSTIEYILKSAGFSLHYLDKETPWNSRHDSGSLLGIASEVRPSWIIIDGYHFDEDYEYQIKAAGYKLLRIDDIPAPRTYYADLILNQNFGADASAYATGPNARILAGLPYVLLRREFREIQHSHKKAFASDPLHILVSLGGGTAMADALNARIAEGISALHDRKITATLFVGKLSDCARDLEREVKKKGWPIEVKEHSSNMAAEMLKADLAIASGGSTMWELMYMKVPFLAVALNEPQREYVQMLSDQTLCGYLGWHEDLAADHVAKAIHDIIRNNTLRQRMLDNYEQVMDRHRIGTELLSLLS